MGPRIERDVDQLQKLRTTLVVSQSQLDRGNSVHTILLFRPQEEQKNPPQSIKCMYTKFGIIRTNLRTREKLKAGKENEQEEIRHTSKGLAAAAVVVSLERKKERERNK
ncbi:unnamed protein product, partial [Ilex paraguariensis]